MNIEEIAKRKYETEHAAGYTAGVKAWRDLAEAGAGILLGPGREKHKGYRDGFADGVRDARKGEVKE